MIKNTKQIIERLLKPFYLISSMAIISVSSVDVGVYGNLVSRRKVSVFIYAVCIKLKIQVGFLF